MKRICMGDIASGWQIIPKDGNGMHTGNTLYK